MRKVNEMFSMLSANQIVIHLRFSFVKRLSDVVFFLSNIVARHILICNW